MEVLVSKGLYAWGYIIVCSGMFSNDCPSILDIIEPTVKNERQNTKVLDVILEFINLSHYIPIQVTELLSNNKTK